DAFDGCAALTLRFYETAPMAAYAEENGVNYRLILRGDVDDNGMVNAADATILSRNIAGADVETKYGADYNRDGVVNSADLTVLRRKLAGADV
ncbi:MAG: dockerin type I repeat-containing protein, partial [Clostridia bacterium]|nr:dockerin type I repeat-containing protein [Clostridia bacterium]